MAADRTVPCPDCGSPVRPDTEQLCPRCGYPLMFLREPTDDTARSVPRAPGVRDDAAPAAATAAPTVPQPQVATAPPTAGKVDCTRCGYRNEADRIRCERCGMELRSAWPVATVLSPPPAPHLHVRRSRTWLLVLAAIVVLAVLATGTFLGVRALQGRDKPAPVGAPPSPAGFVPVNPGEISVTASSTSRDTRFRPANTLDGNRATMWQSDGDRLKNNVGVRLVYRFVTPVVLGRITIVNGAAADATAFQQNQRIARLQVTTDAGATPWDLPDSPQPHALTFAPARTTSVTLVVEKVYPGTRFPDLAVTDVTFERRP